MGDILRVLFHDFAIILYSVIGQVCVIYWTTINVKLIDLVQQHHKLCGTLPSQPKQQSSHQDTERQLLDNLFKFTSSISY